MIELESVKRRISAPAHPSATGIGRVSGLVSFLFSLFSPFFPPLFFSFFHVPFYIFLSTPLPFKYEAVDLIRGFGSRGKSSNDGVYGPKGNSLREFPGNA